MKHESHLEDEAIRYLIQSDSISYAIQDYNPVSRDGYEIIIDYYKKKGDIKNQLKYINQLIYADSAIAKTQKNTKRKLIFT